MTGATSGPNGAEAIVHEAFEIPGSGGETIRGDIVRHDRDGAHALDTGAGVVVLLHGFKGFKDWGFFPFLAREIAARGSNVVSFNASHGGIGADLDGDRFSRLDLFERGSWSAYLEDLRVVVDVVAEGRGAFESIETDRVHLVGHSMGGGLAVLHAAADPRVRSIHLLAPVSHVVRFGAADRERWRRDGRIAIPNARTGQTMWLGRPFLDDLEQNADELDIEAASRRIEVPAWIAHGEADETVPVAEAHSLAEWIPEATLDVVPGASHSFDESHPFTGPGASMARVRDGLLSSLGAAARA